MARGAKSTGGLAEAIDLWGNRGYYDDEQVSDEPKKKLIDCELCGIKIVYKANQKQCPACYHVKQKIAIARANYKREPSLKHRGDLKRAEDGLLEYLQDCKEWL